MSTRSIRLAAVLALALCSPAWAITVDFISGFEMGTGGGLEWVDVSGTPNSTTTQPRTGERSLHLTSTEKVYLEFITAIGAEKAVFQACYYFAADSTPTVPQDILAVYDSSGANGEWRVDLQTDGTLHLVDANGSTAINGTTVLSADTWYCLEVYIDFSGGNSELTINGIVEGSSSGDDFDSGADMARLYLDSSDVTTYVDDVYVYQDLTSNTEKCSDEGQVCEVLWFAGGPASVTPDTGNDLDAGTWANAAEVPYNGTNTASYTGGTASGDVVTDDSGSGTCSGGPAGCGAVYGSIQAGNWLMYAERGNGSGTVFKQRWGNDSDAVTATTVTLTTSSATYRQASNSAATVPTADENCSVGFEKDSGGQDIIVYEQWCYILHQPTATAKPGGGLGAKMIIGE